jgi:hypothetical protein
VEFSLHRELKQHYADDGAQQEVTLGDYRIDVVSGERLIEIQHGSLSAIRDKVRRLLKHHDVLVVKPIVVRRRLIKRATKGGPVMYKRLSPKRGSPLDAFHELVYFTRVFPHRRLALDVVTVDVEEWRYPGHGRRRRRRENDFQVEDQRLLEVHQVYHLRAPRDLRKLLPCRLPKVFNTAHVAKRLGVDRWVAQRIAYCLRETGATQQVGKSGNALQYSFCAARAA